MRQQPEKHLAKEAVNVWRISGLITFFILIVISLIVLYVTNRFDWHVLIGIIPLIISVIIFVLQTIVVPTIRYRRFRYEILPEEIYIQRGIIIVTRTLVPMTRIQHVDTKQGPILKKYQLMTVTISTAATTHEIPALNEEEADRLRNDIAILARVTEDE